MNGREPTRADMFAGADDADPTIAPAIFPLTRVRPESVRDLETGVVLRRAAIVGSLDLFDMAFRDEIAPIGGQPVLGYTLRENVGHSRRRGLEADVLWRAAPRLTLLGNASLTDARIRSYTDTAGVTWRGVAPLLTPRLVANQGVRAELARWLSLDVDGRYTSRMMLTNTGDARLTVPASYLADAGVTLRVARQSLLVRVENLLDRAAFASGYAGPALDPADTTGLEPYYYVVAPRNVSVTMRFAF
jgi:outer membrane receptor protein involved in Fe transport